MKQLIQSYKTGELGLFDVPAPACGTGGVLVRTAASLVSAGTEKMIIDIAKKSLLGKAAARPDLVRQVIDKMKQEGVAGTLEKVFNKLESPIPLGYSCAGRVIEVGREVAGYIAGDRVACGGAGYATHAEINFVPRNLVVRIPDGVSDADASFVTLGAIALQGVRQAAPRLGERVAVLGLGLLGQLTVQLLKANGCAVLGSDPDEAKRKLALEQGADRVCEPGELIGAAWDFSRGRGVDAVIIAASTSSSQPVADAGEIARAKGVVVVVGLVGMDVPRPAYYRKELELKLSMAYGPGRYDPTYEEKGIDYPFAHVRWTEGRNFEAFLDLMAAGKVTPGRLISHRFPFAEALRAYDLLDGNAKEPYLGIVLEYPQVGETDVQRVVRLRSEAPSTAPKGDLAVGLVGAGNFTKSVLLPKLAKLRGVRLVGVSASTGISARALGVKYGFGTITTDGQSLIDDPGVNTLFVTTRHDSHARYVIAALEAGKHVFVEKPLCVSPEELDGIRQARRQAAERGAAPCLMVGFNRRFSPLARDMRRKIGEAAVSIVCRVNAGVVPLESWVQDPAQGGRIVGEVCHFVDVCSFLAGALPVTVTARCARTADRSIPDEDVTSILVGFENGSIATIVYTALGNRLLPKERIEVFAPDLAIEMDDYRRLDVYRGRSRTTVKNAGQDKGFVAELDAFAAAVREGRECIPFASLERTTQTTFAILESLRTGTTVSVTGGEPRRIDGDQS